MDLNGTFFQNIDNKILFLFILKLNLHKYKRKRLSLELFFIKFDFGHHLPDFLILSKYDVLKEKKFC